jgi:hypothetical protein
MAVQIIEIAQTSKKMKIVTEYYRPGDPAVNCCSVFEEGP